MATGFRLVTDAGKTMEIVDSFQQVADVMAKSPPPTASRRRGSAGRSWRQMNGMDQVTERNAALVEEAAATAAEPQRHTETLAEAVRVFTSIQRRLPVAVASWPAPPAQRLPIPAATAGGPSFQRSATLEDEWAEF